RNQRIGQTAFSRVYLITRFTANNRLKITHHGRVRMRSSDGADAVERVADIGYPIAESLVHGILERMRAGNDRPHFRSKYFHAQHIRFLPLDIERTHIDDAWQPKFGTQSGGSNAMHAGTGFGNDALLAHAQSQHDLAKHVVHFVRAGMIEYFPLEIDFGAAAMLREPVGKI